MYSPLLLIAPLHFLSALALNPLHTPISSLQTLSVTTINDDTPIPFYTAPEWPDFGLTSAWFNRSELPTWRRPLPPSSPYLVASLAQNITSSRPPRERAPLYSTYGPEHFVGNTTASIDVRVIMRQYVQSPPRYPVPAGPMLNEELAKVLGGMKYYEREMAVTMCYLNIEARRILNCTGTIMVQRDLWLDG
ncbi:MAG: hypothetical protein Q9177_006479 [Variospora cf. flavescens]